MGQEILFIARAKLIAERLDRDRADIATSQAEEDGNRDK